MEELERWLDRKIYAIGEIGMDCYWSKEFIKEQQTALRLQLELADRLNLPVIIGAAGATQILKSGAVVTLDADRGVVSCNSTNAIH